MSYTASTETVDHLVALVHEARPDWDSNVVRVVLLSHRDQVDGTDLAVAALRAARDASLHTPKVIGWRGKHWDGLDTQPIDARAWTWCAICMKPEPRCVMERFGDDDHEHEPMARPMRVRR